MAASTTPPGVVDPTKPAKYPVILSDALLGKSPKEILTALRYNHRPTLSSDTAPNTAKLKPSSASSASTHELSFTDDGGKYAYAGSRSTKENQYALIFDPERKAFVLHRIDSTFNMNLTRTPSTSDADALKEEYPHIDSNARASSSQTEKKKTGPAKGAGKGKKGNSGMFMENKKTAPKQKATAAAAASSSTASASTASAAAATSTAAAEKRSDKGKEAEKEKKKQQQRNRSPVGSEEDESDDDLLLVEYPDPQPDPISVSSVPSHRSPFPTTIRKFSQFVSNQAEESDEDADAEYDEDDFLVEGVDDEGGNSSAGDGFKLPSPVGRNNNNNNASTMGGGEEVDGDTPEDDELMAMLEEEIGEGGGMDVDSESSVSEED